MKCSSVCLILVVCSMCLDCDLYGQSNPSLPDPVLAWNTQMLDAIRGDNSPPTLATRNLAILHTSIYDAVNCVQGTHQPYRIALTVPEGTSAPAAAIAAGYEVMAALYPSFTIRADELFGAYRAMLPVTGGVMDGFSLGQMVARELLEARSADGSATTVPYIPSDDPGQWRRTPPFFRPPVDPQWGWVDPFCLPDVEAYVPPGPPPLDSEEYAAAFNEVKDYGAKFSPSRTPDQTQIAMFWSDFSYTATPAGHWDEIATSIARARQADLAENARLFALLSIAQADAAIVCWDAKFRNNAWRPVTAIQRADEDGNAATEADKTWTALLGAPSFPEYTSGHSTFTAASAQVLARFYGTDAISFTARSESLPGVFRSFNSLSACADEVGMSRIYGGIHFQFSNRDGKACGRLIGEYAIANYLLPNSSLPLLRPDRTSNRKPAFRVHGHIGSDCVVDTSADLVHWQAISTNRAIPGGTWVSDENPESSARFYRVREL